MANEPMTPGQLAFVKYTRAMIEADYAETLTEDDWDEMLESEREAWEASAEAVRKQMLALFQVDEVFIAEAVAVFEGGCLGQAYPDCEGPIEIIATMISERNALQAFKARVEAGVKP